MEEKNKNSEKIFDLLNVRSPNWEAVKPLLKLPFNPKFKKFSETLLHVTVQCGGVPEVVKTLLDAGADIHEKDAREWNTLHFAVQHGGNSEVVKMLIDAGADVNEKTSEGRNPLQLAVQHAIQHGGVPEVLNILIEAGARF